MSSNSKKAVLISCFDWYEKRLIGVRANLIERGYDVKVLLSDFDHIKKSTIKERYPECIYYSVPPYSKNISFSRVKSHLSFGKSVASFLEEFKPDFIYALIPPNNLSQYCLQYKEKNPGTKYIIDVIDLWPESFPITFFKKNPLTKIWKNMRDFGLKSADGIVLECDLYKESLVASSLPSLMTTIRLYSNYSHEELILAHQLSEKHVFDKSKMKVKFAYIGSLNNITNYFDIISIIRVFLDRRWDVTITIIGDGQNRKQFVKDLKDMGCKVNFLGLMFENVSKIKAINDCDFAFNMMIDSVKVGLTMKSLDYLSIGIPMINSIKGDTWEIIEKHNIGLNYTGDSDLLFKKIQSIDYSIVRSNVYSALNNFFTYQAFENQIKLFLDEVLLERENDV